VSIRGQVSIHATHCDVAKTLGPRSLPKLHEETDLDRLDEDPVRVLSNAGS
jgi:hypothetical protein